MMEIPLLQKAAANFEIKRKNHLLIVIFNTDDK